MNKDNFFKLAISVIIAETAGILGSIFTVPAIPGWYATLPKPAFNPPAWVFGPVWIALFFLIGVSLYLVWKNGWKIKNPILTKGKKAWNPWSERLWTGDWQKFNLISIFVLQYVLNIFWSYLFFGLRLPGLAFFELLALWFSILYLIINFYRVSKPAAWFLLPYILWVSFAGYLNFSIWQLSAKASAQVFCTEEARLCPDGSYVGRTAPDCEFASCPEAGSRVNTGTSGEAAGFGNEQEEKAIIDYLLTQKYFSWKTKEGSTNFCGVENLRPGENLFPIYVWAYCAEYAVVDGKLQTLSGTSLPIKINYPNELSYYDLSKFSHEAPRDGSYNDDDIKRIFPKDAQERIHDPDKNLLIKKVEARARGELLPK
ncbi:MAG: TspO/MBR family protein [Patescibacteria group bacterium]|jgi:tryptophan-rich sensory protein